MSQCFYIAIVWQDFSDEVSFCFHRSMYKDWLAIG